MQVALFVLPWKLRRLLLNRIPGYSIDPTARIGFSIVVPYRTLRLGPGAKIGHLNLMRGMDAVRLGENAVIAHLNWIYAIPMHFRHLSHEKERRAELVLEDGAGVTRRHLIDCSNTVSLGRNALIAGYGTQVLTHAIDLGEGKQGSRPVLIGESSMVGTRAVILGGSVLPGFSALGAGSVLRSVYERQHRIYSGVPATDVAPVDPSSEFFRRSSAYVD
ncbi:MAG: hypothetical protein WC558_06965 [Patulibacter sp.]